MNPFFCANHVYWLDIEAIRKKTFAKQGYESISFLGCTDGR
jgi:hypothetical protein